VKSIYKNVLLKLIDIACISILPFLYIKFLLTKSPRICVLVYHKTSPDRYIDDKSWNVTPETFSWQMEVLAKFGFRGIKIDELLKFIHGKEKISERAVCISFDDGYKDNYIYAYPILRQNNLPGSFFIVSKYIGSSTSFPWLNENPAHLPLSWDKITEMRGGNMEFFSHSHGHTDFSKMSPASMEEDISTSLKTIEEKLATGSRQGFVCPFGIWGPPARELESKLTAQGIQCAFLGKWGAIQQTKSPGAVMDLPRITIYGRDGKLTFISKLIGGADWLSSVYSLWHNFRVKRN